MSRMTPGSAFKTHLWASAPEIGSIRGGTSLGERRVNFWTCCYETPVGHPGEVCIGHWVWRSEAWEKDPGEEEYRADLFLST